MVIGIDASRANQAQKTGVGWYAFHLIQELKKITPENVRVILYADRPLQGELADLPETWTAKALKWFPKRLWTQARLSWEMLVHPPDILFIPAHVFPIIHPFKTIMTVHDIAALKFPCSYNWFERWYSVWSAKYAVKKIWRVIAPSEFTKKELTVAFGFQTADKIKVIYHGYDERYKKKDERDINKILEKYNLKKPYLLSVGRLEEKKNTWRIVEAFNDLRQKNGNLRLVLAGLPGHGYAKVRQAIDASPFKNDIITPGWVEEDDLPHLLAGAEVFVFPSLYEGFGLPLLQAMAGGTPVVASRDSGLAEIGGEAALYVEPNKAEEISRAILTLLRGKELRELKIEQGYGQIAKFSWAKCARETLSALLA